MARLPRPRLVSRTHDRRPPSHTRLAVGAPDRPEWPRPPAPPHRLHAVPATTAGGRIPPRHLPPARTRWRTDPNSRGSHEHISRSGQHLYGRQSTCASTKEPERSLLALQVHVWSNQSQVPTGRATEFRPRRFPHPNSITLHPPGVFFLSSSPPTGPGTTPACEQRAPPLPPGQRPPAPLRPHISPRTPCFRCCCMYVPPRRGTPHPSLHSATTCTTYMMQEGSHISMAM
jgi:hypothetical protein